jgi:hypothetical protein
MFQKPMSIEKNVATIQNESDEFRIVVTVERRGSENITQDDAEIELTKTMPLLFNQRVRFGGK